MSCKMLQFFVVVVFFQIVQGVFYHVNITDFSSCEVYYVRHGSTYQDYFEIPPSPHQNKSLLMDFHFSVLTASDAHILLAPDTEHEQDDVYEIVLGAGGNTFCDIRRKIKANVKASERIKGLLSAVDVRSFWLHIQKDGTIEVGREGEELAFISWTDPDVLPIRYFSLSSWRGVEAKWFYNCQRDEHIKKIERNLTFTDRLRRDLLSQYDPYVRPVKNVTTRTNVSMSLTTDHLEIDEKRSTIQISGVAKLSWKDEKLIWDPMKYGGIKRLHIFRREIWVPTLELYNSFDADMNILGDSFMIVKPNGDVEWDPKIKLKAFCDSRVKGQWPRDLKQCAFNFGMLYDAKNIALTYEANKSHTILLESSEWMILDIEALVEGYPPVCSLVFFIQRYPTFYDTVFYSPFYLIAISLLSSFWLSPFSKLKLSLCCFELLLSTIVLIILALTIPSHPERVPYLLTLYSASLIAGLLTIIIEIIVINLSRNEQKKQLPHFIKRTITSNPMKIAFCLPSFEGSVQYGKIRDTLQEQKQSTWILLGIIIDRIAFIIYVPIIIYTIYLNNYYQSDLHFEE